MRKHTHDVLIGRGIGKKDECEEPLPLRGVADREKFLEPYDGLFTGWMIFTVEETVAQSIAWAKGDSHSKVTSCSWVPGRINPPK